MNGHHEWVQWFIAIVLIARILFYFIALACGKTHVPVPVWSQITFTCLLMALLAYDHFFTIWGQ